MRVEPPSSALGLYEVRVLTKTGISNARPFCVDSLPNVDEAADNGTKTTAQKVSTACVVLGSVAPDTSDFFRVAAKAGEPLTVEVLGRRLGSVIDPVILMHDGDGNELAGLYADDTPGLQADARLTFTPKTSGEYFIEVRDTTYRGGNDYAYRLRIGHFSSATTAFPVAVQRDQKAEIVFTGPEAKSLKPVNLVTANGSAEYVTPRSDSAHPGWPVPVRVSDTPQVTEVEPNDGVGQANRLEVPSGVTGRLDKKNDRDCFRFAVSKGKKYEVVVDTTTINSPAEVLLKVEGAAGKTLGESDPLKPECRVEFTASADGDTVAVCEHLNYVAGPNEVYWLQVREIRPDFGVTLGTDAIAVPAGGSGKLKITGVSRRNGFDGPIELTAVGDDPAATVYGKLTLPADAKPTGEKPIDLPLSVKPGTPLGVMTLRVQCKAGGVTRYGSVEALVRERFAGLANPPPELAERVILGVLPAANEK